MAQTIEIQDTPTADVAKIDTDGLFNKLTQLTAEVVGLKSKLASNKTASTKVRALLMDISKTCDMLRKEVLATKKAIPVKPRGKKAEPAKSISDDADDEKLPGAPPLLERQPAIEKVQKFDLRPTTAIVPKVRKHSKKQILDLSNGI